MKRVRVFQHAAHEGPGYFAEFLAQRGVTVEVVSPFAGDAVPPTLDEVAGLGLMGGPMSVNDPLPWIAAECDLIRRATARGIPVFGHCLGGQLVAKALGGIVDANPFNEIGWFPVDIVPGAAAASWLAGLPPRFEVYHWHGERFSLPVGAEPLLSSPACANQAFVVGKTLALQCHVEMTAPMVREWVEVGREEISRARGPWVQSGPAQVERLEERVQALQRVAERLYDRWLAP